MHLMMKNAIVQKKKLMKMRKIQVDQLKILDILKVKIPRYRCHCKNIMHCLQKLDKEAFKLMKIAKLTIFNLLLISNMILCLKINLLLS